MFVIESLIVSRLLCEGGSLGGHSEEVKEGSGQQVRSLSASCHESVPKAFVGGMHPEDADRSAF